MLSLVPLPYRILAVVAALVALAGGAWLHGYRTGDRSAQLAAMAKDMANLQAARDEWLRQAEAAQQVARDAAARQQRAEAEKASLEQELDDYARELASRPAADVCRLDRDDVERLRSLTAPAAPARPAGAPLDLRPGGRAHPQGGR